MMAEVIVSSGLQPVDRELSGVRRTHNIRPCKGSQLSSHLRNTQPVFPSENHCQDCAIAAGVTPRVWGFCYAVAVVADWFIILNVKGATLSLLGGPSLYTYMGMATALDVSNYILFKSDEEAGDVISNLKLQKLLYYAQGSCLAKFEKPLFDDVIEAWTHGPVVPSIYKKFKEHGSNGIPRPAECPKFDADLQALLDAVYSTYGQFSAWKLRSFTHDEPPWKNTAAGAIISTDLMKDYFKTQVS